MTGPLDIIYRILPRIEVVLPQEVAGDRIA